MSRHKSNSLSIFSDVYFLHGKGGSPNGSVAKLQEIIQKDFPEVDFYRPFLVHNNINASPEVSFAAFRDGVVPLMQPGALLVGISLGGLIASKLQETNPEKNFSVFSICSPTTASQVGDPYPYALKVERKMPDRVALYSSKDEVIAGRTNWADFTDQNYDVNWLVHDVDLAKYAVSYFIMARMRGLNIAKELANFNHTSEVGLEKIHAATS